MEFIIQFVFSIQVSMLVKSDQSCICKVSFNIFMYLNFSYLKGLVPMNIGHFKTSPISMLDRYQTPKFVPYILDTLNPYWTFWTPIVYILDPCPFSNTCRDHMFRPFSLLKCHRNQMLDTTEPPLHVKHSFDIKES